VSRATQYSVWLRAGRLGDRGSILGRGERIFPLIPLVLASSWRVVGQPSFFRYLSLNCGEERVKEPHSRRQGPLLSQHRPDTTLPASHSPYVSWYERLYWLGRQDSLLARQFTILYELLRLLLDGHKWQIRIDVAYFKILS
jgi:hypothetical protein